MTATPSALAACIEMARRAAGGDISPTSEVYWHTREFCFSLTRSESAKNSPALAAVGVYWSEVLDFAKDYVLTDDEMLESIAGPLWEEVMSPDLVVDGVHGS